jgi:hypothetical protein
MNLYVSGMLALIYSCDAPIVASNVDEIYTKKYYSTQNTNCKNCGIWASKEGGDALFDMSADSVYYIDESKSFKYEFTDSFITIHYEDFEYSVKFEIKKDTMYMYPDHEEAVVLFKMKES